MSRTDNDRIVPALVLTVGLVTAVVYLGAVAATAARHATVLDARPSDALAALPRLLRNPQHPSDAWPSEAQQSVPGPWLYWSATAIVACGATGASWWLWAKLGSPPVGTGRRRRLGTEVQDRLATRRDIAPLAIAAPVEGRLTLGRVHGRLVATEHPDHPPAGRRWLPRRPIERGNRSAVAVLGPSQCGKTSNIVCSILEWSGPAVLSSVKGDLLALTGAHRASMGDVYVFDPLHELDASALPEKAIRCGWSPLRSATTIGGAMAVANALLDAAPMDGVANSSFWSRKSEALLWPVLYAAAIGHKSMVDVVRWLALQDGEPTSRAKGDGGREPVNSEIVAILEEARRTQTKAVADAAAFALQQFAGFWMLNDRVRSDVFSTAQTLVQPWEDPRLAKASALEPQLDLDLLLGDGAKRNTLYVSQPLKSAERLAVVFGGLLGDLIAEQAYERAKRTGRELPDLLVVLDEAGNTPVRWLPQVASTCSGIGIVLVTVWQSKAQIDARYRTLADSVLTNHATKIIFSGTSDESTGRYAAYLAGEEEVENRSVTDGDRHSTSVSTARVATVPASVLRRAGAGHALLIHRTLRPAHLRARHVSTEPTLCAHIPPAGAATPGAEQGE